jgi:transposase
VITHPWSRLPVRKATRRRGGRPSKRPFWNITAPIADQLRAGTISRRRAASMLGIHVSTTKVWFPVANCKGGRPSKKPQQHVLEKCLNLLAAGQLTRRQLAAHFNVTTKTTYMWTRKPPIKVTLEMHRIMKAKRKQPKVKAPPRPPGIVVELPRKP